ncbi:hypothetical protein KV205_12165 [Streptomyces sp. SKN60]|uniref:hypothetical protein n=1 Tax=Streptomyces sp. SKN60 TaxID=2855506 RepID=UPI002245026D|nr:hypothetical protein [Streptomyces sp. SKN60]MCX2181280.1 hypothetical protein [Streptomyces sp. SKN60]
MSGHFTEHFTDRDERSWQRRTEERIAEPWALGARLRSLRTRRRARAGARTLRRYARTAASGPESCAVPAQISG